jgi:hypothetical protein
MVPGMRRPRILAASRGSSDFLRAAIISRDVLLAHIAVGVLPHLVPVVTEKGAPGPVFSVIVPGREAVVDGEDEALPHYPRDLPQPVPRIEIHFRPVALREFSCVLLEIPGDVPRARRKQGFLKTVPREGDEDFFHPVPYLHEMNRKGVKDLVREETSPHRGDLPEG